MSIEILNGKITYTKLGEEHGCLTANLVVEELVGVVASGTIASIIGALKLESIHLVMVMAQ